MKHIERFINFVVNVHTRQFESFVSGWSILWGLWLIFNPNLFHTSPVYYLLDIYADETTIGAAMILIGVFGWLAIACGKIRYRRYAAVLDVLAWSFIDATLWFTPHVSTGGVTYAMPVLASIWTLIALPQKDPA